MYEKSFIKRLCNFGVKRIILSWDTFVSIILGVIIYNATNGQIPLELGNEILIPLMQISASLFAIVLAGLAIVTSFTDKEFVYAWKEVGEFDNIITVFQYNMYIPLLVLLFSMYLRFVNYESHLMVILLALFVYMVVSLIDLVGLVSRYGLQRGEFVKQYKDELTNLKLDSKKQK